MYTSRVCMYVCRYVYVYIYIYTYIQMYTYYSGQLKLQQPPRAIGVPLNTTRVPRNKQPSETRRTVMSSDGVR